MENFEFEGVTLTADNVIKKNNKPNLQPNYPFYYVHYPLDWECAHSFNGGEGHPANGQAVLLPVLKMFVLMPGCNGVRQGRRGGEINASGAKAQKQDTGWQFIPYDACGKGYVKRYAGRNGAVYRDQWTKLKVLGDKVFESYDREGFDRWRYALVESGAIEAPHAEVVQGLLALQSRRAARRAKEVHIPTVAKHVESEQAKLEALTVAVAPGDIAPIESIPEAAIELEGIPVEGDTIGTVQETTVPKKRSFKVRGDV